MDAPLEKILFFSALSAEEQADVRAYVEQNPTWEPILKEAQAMADVLQAAQGAASTPPSADMLAHVMVAEQLYDHPLPPALTEALARAEEAIAEDPAYRETYEAFTARLEALTEEADPAAHFERLSGHPAAVVATSEDGAAPAAAADRAATPPPASARRIPRIVQWTMAAAAVVIVLYGVLWGLSELTTPTHERLAAIDADELYVEGFDMGATRSTPDDATSDAGSTDALYLEALSYLQEARGDVLGLFPRFDEEKLAAAETRLQEVVAAEEAGSFVQLDAFYFLGKIHLARGEEAEAREALLRVVRGEGRNAPAAADLLQELAADDAFDPDAS